MGRPYSIKHLYFKYITTFFDHLKRSGKVEIFFEKLIKNLKKFTQNTLTNL